MNAIDLCDILLEDKPSINIKKNEEAIFLLIPELKQCKGYLINDNDLYNHILEVVDNVANNLLLRVSALFFLIGMPLNNENEDYALKSKDIFIKFCKSKKINIKLAYLIENIIYYHNKGINEYMNQMLKVFDSDGLVLLYNLKKIDISCRDKSNDYLLNEYDNELNSLLYRIKNAS